MVIISQLYLILYKRKQMKTRADSKQEEFISSNGKLYIHIEQEEKTDEESGATYWEMEALEVQDRRTAYNDVISYYEAQQARPLRELAIDPTNQYAKTKMAFLDEQIAKYR